MIHPQPTRIGVSGATVLRIIFPVMLLGICGAILWQDIAAMDTAAIWQAVAQVTWMQWALAGVATWCSFQAIGRYDAMWHRHLKTGVPPWLARRSGIRAIAIAQTLGFGALTGSLVRWYSLPRMTLWQATRVSVAVTVAFSACWAVWALLALLWLGGHAGVSPFVPIVIVVAAIPVGLWVRHQFAPGLQGKDIAALLCLTAIDLFCAAVALYLVIPQGADIAFLPLLAAYVIALGVGLIANTPGGAGAFELTLLSLLPMATPEPLIAAIIAFRIVYYLIPATLALLALARPAPAQADDPTAAAMWGLTQQSGETGRIGNVDLLLGDLPLILTTLGPQPKPVPVTAFWKQAVCQGKLPVCYNADPRTALATRNSGWHVRRVAIEAILRPADWTTAGGRRQTLRRKLKQAARAGIVVEALKSSPTAELQNIARSWALSHGGEYGFSMGRFCPQYIAGQRIFLIKKDGYSIGFVSFHTSADEWMLDLIRHKDNVPDGAIHAAIVAAIDVAKDEAVQRLSLASVPDPRVTPRFWANSRAGLAQFKRSFGPVWVPRYHAAPNRCVFWLGGLIIGVAIYRPVANLPWKLAAKLKFFLQKYQLWRAGSPLRL